MEHRAIKSPMGKQAQFLLGLTFWLRGWGKLLSSRQLLVVAVTPLAISFSLFSFVLYLIWTNISYFTDGVLSWLPAGLVESVGSYIQWPILVFLGLVLSVAATYMIYLLQIFIAIPFYSALASRTLRMHSHQLPPGGFGVTWRMFRSGVLKSILFLVLGLFLFVVSFIPGLSPISLFGLFMILSADIFDYSFEAMGLSLGQRLKYLVDHLPQWLGMTVALLVTIFIPGLTIILMSGAIVGAAMTYDPRDV